MDTISFKERKPNKKRNSGEALWASILIQSFLIIASIFLIFNIGRSIQVALGKLDIADTAKGEVDALRLENITLLLNKDALESDDFIETAARDRLNYSKEGEIIFVISETVLEHSKEELKSVLDEEEGELEEKEVWEVWKGFFVQGV